MKLTLASEERRSFLYHYEQYNWNWLSQTILGGAIYLSDTKNYNDPWDCRPCFDMSRLDDPVFYERQVAFFYRGARRKTPHIPEEEHRRRADKLRRNRKLLEACIEQMSHLQDEIQKRYRVYCLTTKPANTLMWSHYSQNHRGVCLEFGCDNLIFSGAFKVMYCNSYPLLDLADDSPERLLLPLIAKSDVWSYEDEYRLIAQEETFAVGGQTLRTKGNLPAIPSNALKSIIIGCNTASSECGEIRELVRQSGRTIALNRMVRIPNRYELAIESI